MANDTIKFKFDVEGSGAVDGAMKEKKRLLDEIAEASKRLGSVLPKSQLEQFSRMGVDSLKQLAQQFGVVENNAKGAAVAVDRYNESLRKAGTLNRLGQGNFNVGPRDEFTRGGGAVSPFGAANDPLLGRFNAAAKSQLNIKAAAREVDDLTSKLGKVPGVTYIGAQALHLFGIQGGRAISIVTRQATEMGTTLEQVFQNPTIGFITLIAGAALAVKGIASVINEFARLERVELETQQTLAHITLGGITGNIDEKTEALKKFIAAQKEFQGSTDPRNTANELGRVLGGRGTEDEVNDARVALQEAKRKRFLFGIESLGEGVGEFSPRFLTKPNTDKINEAESNLRRIRGGIITLETLDARIKQTIKEIDAVQIRLFDAGDRDNIFDKAARSLRNLGREANAQGTVKSFLDNALQQARGGTLNTDDFNDQLSNLQEKLTKRAEQERLRKAAQDSANELVFSRAKETKSARRGIESLSEKLEDNPLARIFVEAQDRMHRFREQFPLVAQGVVSEFEKVNKAVLDLDIFKSEFGQRIGLRKLTGDIERLQSAGSFSDRDITQQEQSRLAEARVKEARFFGSGDDLQIAQAGLFGRGSELEAQARNAHFNDQFVKEAELLNERDKLFRTERSRLVEKDIRDQELTALKGDLSGSGSPEKQRFVLDKILEVTSNIGELNADDRELRLKSLQQRLALGESQRQKVLIEINNNAGDNATVTRDSLGPEPSPDFGNGLFSRGFGQQSEGAQQ